MDFLEWRERRGESADEETERLATAVIGAAIEVHRLLGPGHLEKFYKLAMCRELGLRKIPFACEFAVNVLYKGDVLGQQRIDLLVGDKIVVELKAVERLAELHQSQALSYLAIMQLRLALLINFNVPLLRQGIKRVVRDPGFTQSSPS